MILLIASLFISVAQAQTQTAVPLATGSSLTAYKLARETKWPEALAEATNATKINPNEARAWFILGVCQERLEQLSAAVVSYEKYLKLSQGTEAAKAVEAKLPDLKRRANQKKEDMYGKKSNGFFIEKSLSYSPSYVGELHGTNSSPFGIGFNFGNVLWGYRQFTGTFTEDLNVPDTSTPPVYAPVSGGGEFTSRLMFVDINFSLIDPYTSWGNLQLTLPLHTGFGTNTLKLSSTQKLYGNWIFDFGLGLGIRGYTRSPFSWYVQGVYHLSLPFWSFKNWNEDDPIRNAANEDIKGTLNGFETSAGIIFLFGSETKKHY